MRCGKNGYMKRYNLRAIITIGLSLGLPLALCVLFAWRSPFRWTNAPTPPPPSVTNPSIYPGSQNVIVAPEGSLETPSVKQITFQTGDEPDKVWQYYKELLLKEGWRSREFH